MLCVGTTLITKDFEIQRKKKEEVVAKDREREGSVFLNRKSQKKSVIFLKPSLSIYSIPTRVRFELYGIKIMKKSV